MFNSHQDQRGQQTRRVAHNHRLQEKTLNRFSSVHKSSTIKYNEWISLIKSPFLPLLHLEPTSSVFSQDQCSSPPFSHSQISPLSWTIRSFPLDHPGLYPSDYSAPISHQMYPNTLQSRYRYQFTTLRLPFFDSGSERWLLHWLSCVGIWWWGELIGKHLILTIWFVPG